MKISSFYRKWLIREEIRPNQVISFKTFLQVYQDCSLRFAVLWLAAEFFYRAKLLYHYLRKLLKNNALLNTSLKYIYMFLWFKSPSGTIWEIFFFENRLQSNLYLVFKLCPWADFISCFQIVVGIPVQLFILSKSTRLNILFLNDDVVIPVRSVLLMTKTQSMKKLVLDHTLIIA